MDVSLGFRVRVAAKRHQLMSVVGVNSVLEREPSSHGSHVCFIILHLYFLNPNFICIRFINLK